MRTQRDVFRRIGLFIAPVLLLTVAAISQTTTGSIVGTVTDSGGGVVVQAAVIATNMGTGTTYKLSTNDAGTYVATDLPVGTYSVVVEARGFKREASSNIVINVQDRVRRDFQMEVGSVTESVNVTSSTPLLQTDNSYQGQVIDSQRIQDLPLNGREFQRLAWLTAGVVASPAGTPDASTGSFSANGNRPFQNSYLLDGLDNRTLLPGLSNNQSYVIGPSLDAISEFRVQTNSMSAEFGSAAGAVINMAIKSGTNQLHGTFFEFVRNSAFDAKNFFDNPNTRIPPFKLNQFGASSGGPIVIPGLYHGRNRTFFFADYQGTRISTGETDVATVPPTAWHEGDFSGFRTIYDPQTTTVSDGVATRQAFPNNQIPPGRVDPVAANLISLFPLPNAQGVVSSAGVANNFVSNPTEVNNIDQFDVRLDQQFTDRDLAFLRFSYEQGSSFVPPAIPPPLGDGFNREGDFFSPARTFVLGYTHIFNPRTINEFRGGYVYNHSRRYQYFANENFAAMLGIPGVPFSPGNGGMPHFSVTGITAFGSGVAQPLVEGQNSYQFVDNVSIVHGKHTIKVGAELRPRVDFSFEQVVGARGSFSFSGNFTADPNNLGTTGLGFSDFFLGSLSNATLSNIVNDGFQQPAYSAFFQDDIKLTRKLTVNLGLRYDFLSNVTEKHNAISNFNISNDTLEIIKGVTTPLPSNFDFADIPVTRNAPRTLVPNDYKDVAPRVGFAYNVLPDTVIRGGYGIFYTDDEAGPLSNPNMGLQPPFQLTTSYPSVNVVVPNPVVGQLSQGFPSNVFIAPSTPQFFALDPGFLNPYVQNWHVGVQQSLRPDLLFDISYSGSKGTRLYEFRNFNQAAFTSDPTIPINSRRPLPYLGEIVPLWCSCGSSTYHALEVKLEKRLSNGLSFLSGYTFGKTIDESSAASFGYGAGGGFRDYNHPQLEKGLADFDIRNRFVLSSSYELPFGRGKMFGGNMSRGTELLAGGWSLQGIGSFQTGSPFTITQAADSSNSDGQQYPDVNPGTSPIPAHQGPSQWFNPAAYRIAALGTPGNLGRNTLEGPDAGSIDLSIFKNIAVSERLRLQLRSEFFNVTNHPNFLISTFFAGNPGFSNFDQAGAGVISAAAPSRQIQFALKLIY